MARLRFKALEALSMRKKVEFKLPSLKISDYFGQNAFGIPQMRSALAPEVFEKVVHVSHGKRVDKDSHGRKTRYFF